MSFTTIRPRRNGHDEEEVDIPPNPTTEPETFSSPIPQTAVLVQVFQTSGRRGDRVRVTNMPQTSAGRPLPNAKVRVPGTTYAYDRGQERRRS